MAECIYLDHAATTPCIPEVVDAMLPHFTTIIGNPGSSIHRAGKRAAQAIENAREAIADLLQVQAHEIIFTAGATESLNMAIRGIAAAAGGGHIIACATEHSAVLQVCHLLGQQGFEVTLLPVDEQGSIIPGALEEALQQNTIMVALMHANNETGVLHDLQSIGATCSQKGIPLVCDATQSVGKLPFHPKDFQVDFCAFSAHKFYGPKGVGALYQGSSGKGARIKPLLVGGGQERGLRSGTHNVPGIVGMSAALAWCLTDPSHPSFKTHCSTFESALAALPGVIINGRDVQRIPGIISASFRFLEGGALLSALNSRLCVTAGSSCSSASGKPSHVLTAMGIGMQQAMATIRFSPGIRNTRVEFEMALSHIGMTINQLREDSQTWKMYHNGQFQPIAAWHHPLGE
jgi:cysteine desulfurase